MWAKSTLRFGYISNGISNKYITRENFCFQYFDHRKKTNEQRSLLWPQMIVRLICCRVFLINKAIEIKLFNQIFKAFVNDAEHTFVRFQINFFQFHVVTTQFGGI
jgi:hypothetical protein